MVASSSTPQLEGQVALVTGGSRGLGRAMALGLAGAGADVIIASRRLEACEALAHEVEETTGRRALALACHVGHWEELEGLVDAAYDSFGRVDVLVNNAGMSPPYESIETITEELWDKVHDVNLKGPFRLTSLIAPRMVEHGGGSVINVSAIGSLFPDPEVVPYAAAKAGLNALTVALAHAYGPTVRVNAIVAGMFRTDMAKGWDEATTSRRTARFALGRVGEPEEIVGTALYLASAASSYTSGALLHVTGGFLP